VKALGDVLAAMTVEAIQRSVETARSVQSLADTPLVVDADALEMILAQLLLDF
jgi:NAD(P)H-hydrate repair Nnr-like enzyme with NAD(P)H-hydrate dehydratase domain